ncbi:F-box domain-containing protein [Rutstroemia sp. NJR-2017a BVV2]|nr:F-box domain-containing protein [Rutstroemia sp. NJR-2017a BVV2]
MSQRIYITRTSLAARSLGRNLIKIKLNRQLGQRPSVETLVEKGVLPRECYGGNGGMAPGLIEIKRRVERERMKDGLRAWVEGWKGRVSEREKEVVAARGGAAKVEVRWLVRRFAIRSRGEGEARGMWGRKIECKEVPARAKVLGLRRFWEKVGREGVTAAGGSTGYL